MTYNYNVKNMFCSGYLNQLSNFNGYGTTGSCNFFGNSVFTNSLGNVNYDAMAGYGVFNALFSVANQAIATVRADKAKYKQPDLETNKTQLDKTANAISAKESKITEKNSELDNLNETLSSAGKSKQTLEAKLTNLNLDALKTAWDNAYKEDKNSPATNDAKNKYEEANEKATKIKQQIKDENNKIKETENKIETCKKEIEKLKDEVAELESKQEDLQGIVDNQALEKSKSLGYQRADKKCLQMWSDSNSCKDNIADKKEIRSAIYEFKNASTKSNKKEAANALINMYESNKNEFKTKYGDVYVSVKHWLEDNKENS